MILKFDKFRDFKNWILIRFWNSCGTYNQVEQTI